MKPIHCWLAACVLAMTTSIAPACSIQHRRAEGEPCACGKDCEKELYCTRNAEISFTGSCDGEDGVCRAYRGEGESCNDDWQDPVRCKAPLICRPLEHICGPRLSAGEPCAGE